MASVASSRSSSDGSDDRSVEADGQATIEHLLEEGKLDVFRWEDDDIALRAAANSSCLSFDKLSAQEAGSFPDVVDNKATRNLYFFVRNNWEFIDSSAYTRLISLIQIEDPIEVVVADSLNDKNYSALLIEAINNSFPDLPITIVHKRFFNDERGRLLVQQLANVEVSTVDVTTRNEKKVAMSALASLVKYVEQIQHVIYTGKCVRFTYSDADKMCMMDSGSWKNLEVIGGGKPLGNKNEKRSLLSLLDSTQTFSGRRLLRSNLLQPAADINVIEARLDAVEELVENERIIGLRKTLDIVYVMRTTLENVASDLLVQRKQVVNDKRIDELISWISTLIHQCYPIIERHQLLSREGIEVKLDVARRAYNELISDMQSQEDELKQHLPHQNVRLGYSISRGFHYSWSTRDSATAKLPSMFFDVVRNRSSLTFTSRKLVKYNDRIEQCSYDILQICDAIVSKLMEQVRPLVPILYHLLDRIGMVDFICSLATYSLSTETVRPNFGSGILIMDGYHPLLEKTGKAIPNDTYMTSDSRFSIISGPNMARKSTYLKQVCLLAMMAQVGCMGPAVKATFPIFQRIFSRVGHNDDLTKKLSAFALEMSEMAVILQLSKALDATHKLMKGAYNGPLYGLELAELAGFPESVIEEAKTVAQQLREADKKKSAGDIHGAMERRAYVRCALKLKLAVVMSTRVPKEKLELYLADVKAQLIESLREMDNFRESVVGEGSAIANDDEEG